jgi:hypothetical protein
MQRFHPVRLLYTGFFPGASVIAASVVVVSVVAASDAAVNGVTLTPPEKTGTLFLCLDRW